MMCKEKWNCTEENLAAFPPIDRFLPLIHSITWFRHVACSYGGSSEVYDVTS